MARSYIVNVNIDDPTNAVWFQKTGVSNSNQYFPSKIYGEASFDLTVKFWHGDVDREGNPETGTTPANFVAGDDLDLYGRIEDQPSGVAPLLLASGTFTTGDNSILFEVDAGLVPNDWSRVDEDTTSKYPIAIWFTGTHENDEITGKTNVIVIDKEHVGTGDALIIDASSLTYTPSDPADWVVIPVNMADGLDELADRVTTLESSGGGGGIGAYTLISTGQLLEVNKGYMYESTTTETHLLPVSPAEGDLVRLSHTEVGTSTITVDGNGNDILQYPNTTDTSISLDIVGAYIELTYNGTEWFVSDFSGTIGENSDLVPRNSIAFIEDQKPSGTNGGTFTSGARRTRDLNTITADLDSIVTLNANQFTLEAGTYEIEASAPALGVSSHQCFLQNITDATTDIVGKNMYADTASTVCNESTLSGVIVLSTTKTFEIQHECKVTKSGSGFGGNNDTFSHNVYTQVKITKLGA